MNTEELKQIALAAAKNIKTEQDLAEFQKMLTKVTVEAALNAELVDHLGYERHEKSDGSNHRNGYTSKTVQTDVGQFELDTPRDRKGDFEPQLVKKNQRRFTAMDDKILFLYAQGMSTREIVTTFKEMYGADVSASVISKVTDAVIDRLNWGSLFKLIKAGPCLLYACSIICSVSSPLAGRYPTMLSKNSISLFPSNSL